MTAASSLCASGLATPAVADCRPPLTSSPGAANLLVDAVGAEVSSVRRISGVPIELIVAGQAAVESSVVHQLFRIVQHAIASGVEHSRASSIRVGVVFGDDDVTVIVQGEGGGCDPARLGGDAHTGLPAMQRRAAAVGASIEFESLAGWGTRICVSAPLSARPSALRHAVRVAVVAGRDITRAGIAGLLVAADARIEIVAEAGSLDQAGRLLPAARPDVAVVQLHYPESGWEPALARLCAAVPQARVIVVESAAGQIATAHVLKAGASGWLAGTVSRSELAAAVLAAAGGQAVSSASCAGQADLPAGALSLTQREQQVLELVRRGRRDRQIAAELLISVKTVEKHVGSILRKTEAQNRTELASRWSLQA